MNAKAASINMWTFSGWGKEQHEKVKSAARAGNYPEALRCLQSFGVYAGIASGVDLAETDRTAFDALATRAENKPAVGWAEFYVRLAKHGFIPPGLPAMTKDFFDSARHMVLLARAEKKKLVEKLWPKPELVASTKPFFPEMLRRHSNRRDRICAIASDHANLGPGQTKQAALFSLGGLYGFQAAKAGTKPGVGTTCLLFSRSVLHAAGCNVIGGRTSRYICNCPSGMMAELPKSTFGYVSAAEYDNAAGTRPQRGDIFHIKGDNFKDKTGADSGNDSSHVGIIVEVLNDKSWITVEGGASDHVTRRRERKLVAVTSNHGKWAFEGDTQTTAGVRPLQGWWSVDKISSSQWMLGA
jgi:hypothetical protein